MQRGSLVRSKASKIKVYWGRYIPAPGDFIKTLAVGMNFAVQLLVFLLISRLVDSPEPSSIALFGFLQTKEEMALKLFSSVEPALLISFDHYSGA